MGPKTTLKPLVSSALSFMGRLRTLRGTPVLLYHSVDETGSIISVTPKDFAWQMAHLADLGYHTVTLVDYVRNLTSAKAPDPRGVLLTFDDGFRDNLTEAFPILRRHGFTATIFLATDHVGGVCCWERHPSIQARPLLSWDEIREMHKDGIDFQSHTCSHPFLTRLPEAAVRRELIVSRTTIEDRLGKEVLHFCHPYGADSALTQRVTKECGYASAFGNLDFTVTNHGDRLYDLGRIGTAHLQSPQDMQAALLGTYQYYLSLRKLLPGKGPQTDDQHAS